VSVELCRHVNALVANLAADRATVDLASRCVECTPRGRDALMGAFDAFGVTGGAGVRVHDRDRVLLVRYTDDDRWIDPDDSRLTGARRFLYT
jgi:hypothetical protein